MVGGSVEVPCEDIFELFFWHNLLHHELERCFCRCASFAGLSPLELQVLWLTSTSNSVTLADLASVTTHSKKELERVVKCLEQDGLVEEIGSKESDYVCFQPTNRGQDVLGRLFNRPSKCRCVLRSERDSVKNLLEVAREVVFELKRQGSCGPIAKSRTEPK